MCIRDSLSLCIGIFIGVIILCGGNPLTAFPVMFRDYIIPPLTSEGNIRTLIIIIVIQGMAKMLKLTGAGPAMANSIKKVVKTKRGAETITTVAGFAFIYTCLLYTSTQRADDNAETVANRIEVYEAQTMPLIKYYEKAGNIAHIDGATGLENVFGDIVKALGE